MKMCGRIVLVSLCLFGFLAPITAANNQYEKVYTIVAPQTVRPFTPFNVALSVGATSSPTNFDIEVRCNTSSGQELSFPRTAVLEPFSSKILTLKFADLPEGDYNLTSKISGGVTGNHSSVLHYIGTSQSLLIQTDKAVYSPGQKIKFRVISVDQDLKPASQGKLVVNIDDAKGNRLKQWQPTEVVGNVFDGELQLSDQPVTGVWVITAKMGDNTEVKKTIDVAEYVLPKFEVTVDLPSFVAYDDDNVPVTVKARYTFGEKVRGRATVRARDGYREYSLNEQTVDIDGDATVAFSIRKELRLPRQSRRDLTIHVTVEEELTGRHQNGTSSVVIYKHPYKMEFYETKYKFKPGLPYTAQLKITDYDGVPVQDSVHPVSIFYRTDYDVPYTLTDYPVPSNGLLELEFNVPDSAVTLDLYAEYRNVNAYGPYARVTSSHTYISTMTTTEKPKVGSEMTVKVLSSKPLLYYSYTVVGRTNVEICQTVHLGGAESDTFSFVVTPSMAPRVSVVVTYFNETGVIADDKLTVEVEGTLQNFVNLKSDREKSEPGSTLNITVTSQPDSSIYLLGVDQSVTLMKTGNDITEFDLLAELEKYSLNSPIRPYYYYGRGSTKIEGAGCVLQTNGIVKPHFYSTNFRTASYDMDNDGIVSYSDRGRFGSQHEELTIRKEFPEVWIWENMSVGLSGEGILSVRAPDTITSWVVTGFSMNSQYGMGVTAQPEKFRVFRPFFLSTNLPYSVIRGEVISLQVIVFNYLDQDQSVEVTLNNTKGQFQFPSDVNEITPVGAGTKTKNVVAKSGAGTSVFFTITPETLGYIDINVNGRAQFAGDAIMKKLLVKAEGKPRYESESSMAIIVESNQHTVLSVNIPEYRVQGSEYITFSVIGDIMGPAVNNLGNLLRLPYGCGEQNMLNFVPNIVVTQYLQNTGQLTEDIKAKALRFMEMGYQRELRYQRFDGSFSAFGEKDESGSTWLTAFVARSFGQARPFIDIDNKVVTEALDWLASVQTADGSFPEVGQVSYKAMQGGSGEEGLALTAYTLLAFLENRKLYGNDSVIETASSLLSESYGIITDPYIMGIVTYALHLSNHPAADDAFDGLKEMGTYREEDDMLYWYKRVPYSERHNPWYYRAVSVDVELTSYALLTYLHRDLVSQSVPIVKWLVSQMNDNGGFASTQDTVIGLFALSEQAASLPSQQTDLQVRFVYNGQIETLQVTPQNKMVLQKRHLPSTVRQVEVDVEGTGLALLQLTYSYNLDTSGEYPLFALRPTVESSTDNKRLRVDICVAYTGIGETNMAVMEVALPSGYTADSDVFPTILETRDVKKVETKDGNTVVDIYFDKLTSSDVCITVEAERAFRVAEQKPVPVVVYDYYDLSQRATEFYSPVSSTVCDICDGDDCPQTC